MAITPDYKQTFWRRFPVNEKTRETIISRYKDFAPKAILKTINESPKYPKGGYVRVLIGNGGDPNMAEIEIKKCTGYSEEYNRYSIH